MMGELSRYCHIIWVLLVNVLEVCQGGSYCIYLHEDYYTYREIYCQSGCCRDYGDDDEICCFNWTVGIILGIGFACVGFIALIVFAVICCHHMKKRQGHVIHPASTAYPQNNTVVYTSAPSAPPYPYAQPQVGYYPGSQFQQGFNPGAPPPYTAGAQPAYMPTRLDQSNDTNSVQQSAHARAVAGNQQDPAYPPPATGNFYGGYGTGQAGQNGQHT